MNNQDDLRKIDISEIIEMCECSPSNVTLSNRAINDGFKDFQLLSSSEIKKFIGDGNLEDTHFKGCSPSDQIPGVIITAYTFRTGTKYGYLAYHGKPNDKLKIHIKSFHKDDYNPNNSIGSLADVFPKIFGGGNDE